MAETMAKMVTREIMPSWFGMPRALHSDHVRTFASQVMGEIAQLLGVNKTRSMPYHPQADGQVGRFNWTLAAMLSMVVAPDQKDWDNP